MRDSVMWSLVSAVVISALLVVNVRHQHRIAYLSFQAEESRRDALNDEWGQLLVEANLWSFPHRIVIVLKKTRCVFFRCEHQ